MNKNTVIANITTVGGIGLALAIAQYPLMANVLVMSITGAGCAYLTRKHNRK